MSKKKNRTYDVNMDEYRDIIYSNQNYEIENFINNLTLFKVVFKWRLNFGNIE